MRTLRTALAVGAVALLAACSGSGDSGDADSTGDTRDTADAAAPLDLVGSWQLTSGSTADGDLALIEDAAVTLDVTDELTVAGQSACNRYMGSVVVDGATVTFSPLASTMMACEEPVMALEAAYLRALEAVDSGTRDADALTLTGEGVELVFGAQGAAG